MEIIVDKIDIFMLSIIYGGLILLPVIHHKKSFPWRAVIKGIVIAIVAHIALYIINLLLVKFTGKPLGDTSWNPQKFFFVNIPLFVVISLYLAYSDKSKKTSSKNND